MTDDKPLLWNLEFDWHHSIDTENAGGKFHAKTKVAFSVKTEIDSTLKKQNDSAEVSGSVAANAQGTSWDGDPGSGGATVRSLTCTRRFDTGLPELKGDDNPSSSQPPDTFRFEGTVSAPQIVETHYTDPRTGEQKTVTKTVMVPWKLKFDIPYEPGQKEKHEGDVDLLPYLNGVIATMPPGVHLNNPEGSVHYMLQQKTLDLLLQKTDEDLTKYTPYKANVAKTKNVWYNEEAAKLGMSGTHTLHGNIFVQATVDGKEQVRLFENGPESAFHIWRIARTWTAIANEAGDYRKLETGKAPDKPQKGEEDIYLNGGWTIDNRGADNVDWVDVPGAKGIFKSPGTWPSSKNINEFLVSVDKYPEFGILYFASIIYTRPGKYYATVLNFGKIDRDVAKKIYRNPDCPFFMNEGPGPVQHPGDDDWTTVEDP